MTAAFLAIDWGTTNRRTYAIAADGSVLETVRDDRGVLSLSAEEYPSEIASLRRRFGDLPIIAAGMIGSTRGWRDVPYVAAPVDLPALAAQMMQVEGMAIVPGVSLLKGARADVMRGEEVQVLGASAAGLAPTDGCFCQPGTHNKWVILAGGRITDFATAMTGELFALLRGHGILSGMLDGDVADGPAFRDGIARGLGATDLPVALFEVRGAVLLGTLEPKAAASFASGLLIGADVGSQQLEGRTVHLLSTGPLADLYGVAISAAGARFTPVDSEAAFAAGVHRLWELTR